MEILTDDDKRQVLDALRLAEELRREIARAKRAGIDVTDLEEQLRNYTTQLTNIRNVYVSPTRKG